MADSECLYDTNANCADNVSIKLDRGVYFPLLERVMCERGIPSVLRVIIKVLAAIVFLPLLSVYFLVLGLIIGFAIFMIKIDRFNIK